MPQDNDITRILSNWERDPALALEQLTPLVYSELRRLAAAHLRGQRPDHTLQPTALVHEAYLRLLGADSMEWKDRGHFFGIAARTMRLILVDAARKFSAEKRGSGKKLQFEDGIEYSAEQSGNFLELDRAIEKLKEWDERKCAVLEMKYFGGLEREDIAQALGVSLGTVKRDLSIAEAFLRKQLADATTV